jgi:hypothetical protein
VKFLALLRAEMLQVYLGVKSGSKSVLEVSNGDGYRRSFGLLEGD